MTKKHPERDDDPVHKDDELELGGKGAGGDDAGDDGEKEPPEPVNVDETRAADAPPAGDPAAAPDGPGAAALETDGPGPGARTGSLVDAIFINLSASGGTQTVEALAQAFKTTPEEITGAVGDSNTLEFDGTFVRIKPSA